MAADVKIGHHSSRGWHKSHRYMEAGRGTDLKIGHYGPRAHVQNRPVGHPQKARESQDAGSFEAPLAVRGKKGKLKARRYKGKDALRCLQEARATQDAGLKARRYMGKGGVSPKCGERLYEQIEIQARI